MWLKFPWKPKLHLLTKIMCADYMIITYTRNKDQCITICNISPSTDARLI